MNRGRKLFVLAISLWICSCVEPYSINVKSSKRLLTIDATLTDLDVEQIFTISESVNVNNDAYSSPVQKAKVELLVNGTERIQLTEKKAGAYSLPATFKTKAGNTYQLFFQKADGTKYESGVEKMTTVPEIIKVYDEFELNGIPKGNEYDPANFIYLDTQDPADEKNNYLWSWKLWERQAICMTCENGRYFEIPNPPRCRTEDAYAGQVFDYYCNSECWDVFYNENLNVYSDIYSNGKLINGRLIAKIPYYSLNGSLIEVKQQSVSPDAYRYFKLLADQVQNNGSLVDTPPAAIIGNIKNANNSEEPIAGFFMATSVRTVKYWINRENALGKARPIGLLDHPITPEQSFQIGRPPLVPCVEGNSRTKIKPPGWVK